MEDFIVFLSEQWLLLGVLTALMVALTVVESRRGGQSLTYHQVTRLVNRGEAVIVDVREAKEFKSGHIVDALNIPHLKMAERITELNRFKEKTVVVVDKMGQHSGAMSKVIKEKGFKVNRMQGGMVEWQSQNLPVIKR